jgi:tRNA A37 threonylcarbamoyladenosine synthetase subunit TsaC/SUA5/YrdC
VLTQNDQWITMRVQGNPFIDRLLAELRLPVIPTAAVRARSRQPQRMSEQIN